LTTEANRTRLAPRLALRTRGLFSPPALRARRIVGRRGGRASPNLVRSWLDFALGWLSRSRKKVIGGREAQILVGLLMRRDEAMRRLRDRRAELQRLGVEHLYMFGSTARDAAHEDSDIDLFFDYPRGKFGLYELMEVKDLAMSVLGQKTDIITRDSLHKALRASIEASAVLVF
jgi:hypothetical protein